MIATAVIAAGGSGSRLGAGVPKQFLPVLGIPLIVHTLRAFENAKSIDRVVVVLPASDLSILDTQFQRRHRLKKVVRAVAGGVSRQESVLKGLSAIDWSTPFVAIHDAARCLILPEFIDRTVKSSEGWDGAIAAMPVRDTLKIVEEERILSTEPRDSLWAMQTPQVFRFPFILDAYKKAEVDQFCATDDAQVVEHFGGRVRVVQGSTQNLKVTYPEDLKLAETILREREVAG